MNPKFFPARTSSNPTIYAYLDTNPQYKGLLKIGFTNFDAKRRVAQQYPTLRPGALPYKIMFEETAMRNDGSIFMDLDVHKYLRENGYFNPEGEWFKCNVADIKAAMIAIKSGQRNDDKRTETFGMRPEQQQAVDKTYAYFQEAKVEKDKIPRFLWNAKMRFGKTFASYQLALKMGWTKILVLTFKPAVRTAWEEDLNNHVDFKGWQFVAKNILTYEKSDKSKPMVCFASFQDFLGKNELGGIKEKNEWAHNIHWDCVILDEYHYGAWRDNAKDLFEVEDKKEQQYLDGGLSLYDQEQMPLITKGYLYLSGTPFRAIGSGEFIEEQIYNWTYSDEQRAKTEWKGTKNPYLSLARMVLLTYQLPAAIREIALKGEFDEFDLNIFFSAENEGVKAVFKYEDEVQKWLNLIRGEYLESSQDDLRTGTKPPMPFSDVRLLGLLSHTFWFLPTVSSCFAMKNLLAKRQNKFYHEYKVIVCAGTQAGIGAEALPPVLAQMANPLESKTITLSCGKLTTGVSVKPWTGMFMLRNTTSPETYFQAAFRVQTPWVIKNPEGDDANKEVIIKEECYVFDFAPDRALRQIQEYSCSLDVQETNPEKKVADFIKFLPVLCYDGSSMRELNPADVLDMAMSGTTATLLARRWQSALLVNVDNATLKKLMESELAMKALMSIEGFRNLNQEITTIINKSDAIKKAKKAASNKEPSKEEKKQLTEDEKKQKSLRKEIQDKLIKFSTRIPVFMYLTDYREKGLKDVITQLEPALFKKVTGLSVADFEILVSLNVFNSSKMNEAVHGFKRYEDASLSYSGISKHEIEQIGLYDTVIGVDEFKNIA